MDPGDRPFLREAVEDMTKKEGMMRPGDHDYARFRSRVEHAAGIAMAVRSGCYDGDRRALMIVLRSAAEALCEAIRLAGGPVVELVIAPEDPLANPRPGAIVPGLPADPTLDMITARTPEVVTVQDPPTG